MTSLRGVSDGELQIRSESASLRLKVEETLRRAIATGRFRPGERLVERELCAMLGVGRTSIREALRQLEAEGLIVTIPRRGPAVASMTVEEARQLYDVRALLEGFAGRACATHATAEQLARIERAVALLAEAIAAGTSLIEAKTAFYDALLESCGNDVVRQMLTGLHNRINLLRATSMVQPGRVEHSLKEIRAIQERIATRDPEGAEAACVQHIRNAAEVALATLARATERTEREGDSHG